MMSGEFRCVLCNGVVKPERVGLEMDRGDFMMRGFCPHCEKRTALVVGLAEIKYEPVDDGGETD